MDKKEKVILEQLIHNSRLSLTQLAKNISVSREVTTYHFNKLVKDKVILEFVSHIDIAQLGYVGAAVFVNIKVARHEEFENYLREAGFVSWVAEHSGLWSFGFSIYGQNNEEVDQRFHDLYTKFKDDIIDHRFALHKQTIFFYEKYLGLKPKQKKHNQRREIIVDELDKKILQQLAHNARMDNTDIARLCQVSIPTVSRRIVQLEKYGVIQQYSIFLDIRKLGLYQYSVFVANKNIDEREKMQKNLANHSNVSFIAEYIGDPFFEFGVFVKDPYELRAHLQQIEEQFPNNRALDISLFQKEFVSTGPPVCVFN